MTSVMHLPTGSTQIYSCPPNEAVVCAFEQHRKNNNTWTYDFGMARLSKSGLTVSCGDFSAIMEVCHVL